MDNKKKVQQLLVYMMKEEPIEADVIVLLQGDRLDRAQKVLDLYKNDFAPLIVVTGNNELIGTGPRPGENDISLDEIKSWLNEHGVSDENIVIDDRALNTYEQSMNVLKMAQKNSWKKILLVTSPYHQPRAFLTFFKTMNEMGWDGEIINQVAEYLQWNEKPSGRDKTADELFKEEIEKIEKYSQHVADTEEGISYLRDRYKVRNTERGDSKRVWEIRNHPVSREFSSSPEEISFEEHVSWFEKKYFSGEGNHCFILTNEENQIIGYCRFDYSDADNYVTSIAIDPDYYGMGLGNKLLKESIRNFPYKKSIIAEVQKSNIPSFKLFKKNQFDIYKEDSRKYYLIHIT